MIVTVFVLLAIAAFIVTLVAAVGRVPLWIAVVTAPKDQSLGFPGFAPVLCRPKADRSFLCFTVQLLPLALRERTSKLN
jgi:hypothetical protein